jgi:hypothetical protein
MCGTFVILSAAASDNNSESRQMAVERRVLRNNYIRGGISAFPKESFDEHRRSGFFQA